MDRDGAHSFAIHIPFAGVDSEEAPITGLAVTWIDVINLGYVHHFVGYCANLSGREEGSLNIVEKCAV